MQGQLRNGDFFVGGIVLVRGGIVDEERRYNSAGNEDNASAVCSASVKEPDEPGLCSRQRFGGEGSFRSRLEWAPSCSFMCLCSGGE